MRKAERKENPQRRSLGFECGNCRGLRGIGILMIAENVFPPIPSELIMPVAGFLVQEGRLSFAGVTAAGALGATLGALPLYYVGWKIGERRLRRFANRHGRKKDE